MRVRGYEVAEVLHSGSASSVYRGKRSQDGRPVVLKVLHAEASSGLGAFKREFELLRRAAGPQVIEALTLVEADGTVALALEDTGGASLDRLLSKGPLALEEALRLAVCGAQALAWLHQHHIVHKDVNPSNVVLDARAGLKLIDFGLATTLQRETAEVRSASRMAGTLAYIAPEQTGRTNRGIDSRADLYSFGVMLFEMIEGRRPFERSDPLELMHAHLALEAPRLTRGPALLADLVARLLAKLPEDRYQTAEGVQADLEALLAAVREGAEPAVTLGAKDVSDRLVLPERIFGRDDSRRALLGAVERVRSGAAEWLGIGGPSGIGKSRLVAEVLVPLSLSRGYLGVGKHEQLHRERACAGLLGALAQCLRQVLSEAPERVAYFRDRVAKELVAEARVAADELPELAVLLGATQPVQPLAGQEAQNRFIAVLRRLVAGLAGAEHPLVLFLDDLQWADATTFRVLTGLLGDPETHHLLVLGAYRSDELDALHPLRQGVALLQSRGVAVSELELAPLSNEDVAAFLSDALRQELAADAPLAQTLRQKTGGNPLFLGRVLLALHEAGALKLDRSSGRFTWDEAEVRRAAIAENVVALMTAGLARLPAVTSSAVQEAACLGSDFDLETLAGGGSAQELYDTLLPALEAGYLEAQGTEESTARGRLRFAHDRVQQAAYAMLSEERRDELHLRFGRALREGSAEHPERAFAAAEHLNRALHKITDPQERRAVSELDERAGRRAFGVGVFDVAARLLRAGHAALPTAEERKGRRGLALLIDCADALLLSGDREASARAVEEALSAATDPLDRARALLVRVTALTTELPMSRALDTGLEALALLGIQVPRHAGKGDVLATFARLRLALRRIEWRVSERPLLHDERLLLATRILQRLQGVAFEVSADVFMVAAFRLLLLGIEHGVTASTTGALGTVALALGPAFGDWSNALECRSQAYALLERPECASGRGFAEYVFRYFIDPWTRPFREAIPPMVEGVRHAMGAGEHEGAGYLLFAILLHRLCVADNLDALAAETPAMVRRLQQVSPLVHAWLGSVFQAIDNLRGEGAKDPCSFEGEWCSARSYDLLVQQKNRFGLVLYDCQRLHQCALFGRFEEVLTLAEKVDAKADLLLGQVYLLRANAYAALAGYDRAAASPPWARAALFARARLRHLKATSAANRLPANFGHLAALLEAEQKRALGNGGGAVEAYERAIAAARDNGFTQDEALCCERLGRLFRERHSEMASQVFLRAARLAYLRWGARAKVSALDLEFPELRVVSRGPAGSSTSSTIHTGEVLDFRSLMKAAYLVSSELSLDTLLPRFARIALENAGAERCCLFLGREERLRLVATASADGRASRESAPMDEATGFSRNAVQYAVRTGKVLAVGDARVTPPWSGDAHVRSSGVRSLLALPLRHQGSTVGALYLETRAGSGGLSPERVEVLELLASQAAASIEVAQLYASLEHKVQERTNELRASLENVVETQRQLAGELAEASAFVRTMLPAPLTGAVRSSWQFVPSAALGGDGLGYQWLDEKRLAVYVLDACGHGVKASLLSISALSCLNNRLLPGTDFGDPSAVAAALNRTFPSSEHGNLFFTLWYGVLDFERKEVRYVSAGHPPALLLPEGSEEVRELESGAPLVGVLAGAEFPVGVAPLEERSRLLVFSDGVYEVEGADGRMMRYEDFVRLARSTPPGSLERLVEAARAHRGSAELEDDFSVVELVLS